MTITDERLAAMHAALTAPNVGMAVLAGKDLADTIAAIAALRAAPDLLGALKLASNKFAFVSGLSDPMNVRLFAEGAKKFCDEAIAKAEGRP